MPKRNHPEVVLLEDRGSSMASEWHYQVVVTITARRVFTVKTQHWGGAPPSRERWHTVDVVKGLRSTAELLSAIEACVAEVGEPDWCEISTRLSAVDWVTAVVVAAQKQVPVPKVPADLWRQRSLRALGKVEIGVEWGYDWHYLKLPFAVWLDILEGESYADSTRYYACGARWTADWVFDRDTKDQLSVTYDDGGVGWTGRFSDIPQIKGPEMEGVDLAQAALDAGTTPG